MFSEIVENYLKILRDADVDVFHKEFVNYEKRTSQQAVEDFKKDLGKRLNITFDSSAHIQDAYYIDSLYISKAFENRVYRLCIIISHYSNLVTIQGNLKDYSINLNIRDVVLMLEKHGFTYVPYDIVSLPYETNGVKSDHFTWFDRYFEYI